MATIATDEGNEPAVSDDTGWRSPARLAVIAGIIFAILVGGYFLFIRTNYVPLLTNVAPQDAVAIVNLLEEQKVPYRLEDEGRTILVASDMIDAARIEIVGSELPMRGQVGFELFNESDMGLTEFAQKINYQRALQGELARTILLLKGIDAVRVHLGLPERGVFRDEQAQPKASVTLILKPGTTLTEGTVTGIQRMVAGAVPEMRLENVSVLDGNGRVVSNEAAPTYDLVSGSDAILENYRTLISTAIGRLHPDLRYDLNLSIHPLIARAASQDKDLAEPSANRLDGSEIAPRGHPDFAVSVRITTQQALDENQRLDLLRIVRDTIAYDQQRGDAIQFLVGDVVLPQPVELVQSEPGRVVAQESGPVAEKERGIWEVYWPLALLAGVVLLVVAWLRDKRRTVKNRNQELTTFAHQLRERLDAAERHIA